MKLFTKSQRYSVAVLLLLSTSTYLIADLSIDEQIQKIKNASPSERVTLMNLFKQKVSQMNNKERANAIGAIRSKINAKASLNSSIKSPISQMQIQKSEDISSYQNMNQQQIQNLISREKQQLQENFSPQQIPVQIPQEIEINIPQDIFINKIEAR